MSDLMGVKTPTTFMPAQSGGAVGISRNADGAVSRATVRGYDVMAPATMGHELGHVRNMEDLDKLIGPKRSKAVFDSEFKLRKHMKYLSPVAAGIAASEENPSWLAAGANLAMHTPQLLDEGLASARSFNAIRGKKGLGYALKSSKGMGLGFASYAAPALAPAAITGARKLYRKFKGQDNNG